MLKCLFFYLCCFCRLNLRALRWSQALIFFIEEINRSPVLLPNITLGYRIYDTCWTVALSARTALSVVSQPLKRNSTGACSSPNIPLVIGDSGSSLSIAVSTLLNLFKVPLVRSSLCRIFRVKCVHECDHVSYQRNIFCPDHLTFILAVHRAHRSLIYCTVIDRKPITVSVAVVFLEHNVSECAQDGEICSNRIISLTVSVSSSTFLSPIRETHFIIICFINMCSYKKRCVFFNMFRYKV